MWTDQQRCLDLLARHELQRDLLSEAVAQQVEDTQRLVLLEAACERAAADAAAAWQRAEASGALVAADADRIRDTLVDRWDAEREGARQAARVVLDGPGRFGFRRAAVARAGEQLTGWYTRWVPHLPGLPADNARLTRVAAGPDHPPALGAALEAAARRAAERTHPEQAELTAAADAALQAHQDGQHELTRARRDPDARYGSPDRTEYAQQLADAERALAATRQELTDVRARIATLQADPALRAQPPDRLRQESDTWRADRDAAHRAPRTASQPPRVSDRAVRRPRPEDLRYLIPYRAPGRSIGR